MIEYNSGLGGVKGCNLVECYSALEYHCEWLCNSTSICMPANGRLVKDTIANTEICVQVAFLH